MMMMMMMFISSVQFHVLRTGVKFLNVECGRRPRAYTIRYDMLF